MNDSSSKIFVLCGFSASGKDTLLNLVVNELNVNSIISHTSRPQRDGEVNGNEYNFISKKEFISMINNDEVVEYREYNTLVQGKKDTWFYGITKKAISNDKDSVVVLDSKGAKSIQSIYGDRAVVIFINLSDEKREQRAKLRGGFDSIEWNRRLEDDREIFNSGVTDSFNHIVENNHLETTLKEIQTIIQGVIL